MPAGQATNVTDLALGLILVVTASAAAVWPVSELLLMFYRWSVVRAMGGIRSAGVRSPPGTTPVSAPGPLTFSVLSATEPEAPAAPPDADSLYRRATRARLTTVVVYAAAGLACAATLATATAVRWHLGFVPWLILLLTFAWPAIGVAMLSGVVGRRMLGVVGVVYLVVLIAGMSVMRELFIPLLLGNAGITAIPFVLRAHRIRAVAPLVAGFLTIQGVAFMGMLGVLGVFDHEQGITAADAGIKNPLAGIGLMLLLLVAGPMAGWFTLRIVGRGYEHKRASDQAITMSAMWLPIVSVQSLAFGYDDLRWMLAGVFAFAVFVAVSIAGFRWMRRRGAFPDRGPRLLVLRVFALGRRSRRLFNAIADGWRYGGSIQLIAGPDLATATVEPHEFFDFLRRKLASRFLDDEQAVDRRLAEMDLAPDHDGRFRVTDFLCRDHAWRTVLHRLARESDVVLMDLRGFSTANAGCTYEIGELLNTVPVSRVVLVSDKYTDERFLSQVLANAWARMPPESPNHGLRTANLKVFRETGWRGLDRSKLLLVLVGAAAQPAPSAVPERA